MYYGVDTRYLHYILFMHLVKGQSRSIGERMRDDQININVMNKYQNYYLLSYRGEPRVLLEENISNGDRYFSKTYYHCCQQSIFNCQFQCDISDVTYSNILADFDHLICDNVTL